MAGINAALLLQERDPFVLDRADGYIGGHTIMRKRGWGALLSLPALNGERNRPATAISRCSHRRLD
jgi:hypothetical protein